MLERKLLDDTAQIAKKMAKLSEKEHSWVLSCLLEAIEIEMGINAINAIQKMITERFENGGW